jgi:hypothetical protein
VWPKKERILAVPFVNNYSPNSWITFMINSAQYFPGETTAQNSSTSGTTQPKPVTPPPSTTTTSSGTEYFAN